MTTPIMDLTEMVQAQAHPYVLFNEAVRALEKLAGGAIRALVTDATVEHTVDLTEWGALIRMTSGSANDVVIPTDATLGIAATDLFQVRVRMAGAGVTTIAPESEVTVNGTLTLSADQTVLLVHIGEDEWDLID